jgi:hypothetical protein
MQVEDRVVVISIEGVVLLDGYLESMNGVPAVEAVEGQACVHDMCVISCIMIRPGCEDMDIPVAILSTDNVLKIKDLARKRWIFPTKMVFPFTSDAIVVKKIGKRTVQHVPDLRSKIKAVKWISEWKAQHGNDSKGACSAVVKQFPEIFRSSHAANIEKARSWWNLRDVILKDTKENGRNKSESLSISKKSNGVRVVKLKKTQKGRGRKLSPWKKWLYPKLIQGVLRFIKGGVGMNTRRIIYVAKRIIEESQHALWNKQTVISCTYKREKKQKNIMAMIDSSFVQGFVTHFDLVLRSPSGKMLVSPQKMERLEKEVAYHLGELKLGFESGMFDPNDCYNVDETHFIMDMRKGNIFVSKGEKDVKLMDIVSGSEGFTVVMTLKGGMDAKIMNLFVIFKNKDSSYPISNVPDNVPHVTYRSNPTAFMNKKLFETFLGESRIWGADDPNGKVKHVWADNVASHNGSIGASGGRKNIEKRSLPANTTHLCQPCDQFVIAKFKEMYKELFDDYVLSAVEDGIFQQKVQADGTMKGSGKIKNPGKSFVLKLLSKVLIELNEKKDKDGMSWAQKAMVGCGLGLDRDGKWTVEMLFPKLRKIVEKYPDYFSLAKNPNGANESVVESVLVDDDNLERNEIMDALDIQNNEQSEMILDEYIILDDEGGDGSDSEDIVEVLDDNIEGLEVEPQERVRHRLVPGKDDALIADLVASEENCAASFCFEDEYDDVDEDEI